VSANAQILSLVQDVNVAVPANASLQASNSGLALNNQLSLGAGATSFNFSGATGSFSQAVSGLGYYYTDYLFSFSPSSAVQSATITLDNTGGVSNLSERVYAYAGSFLGDAVAGTAAKIQGWTVNYPIVGYTVANLASPSLAGGTYVLEVRGTNQGNFGGAISLTPVPEPESLLMLMAGLCAIGSIARRSLQNSRA
jgi:hypothetical protein